MYQNVGGEIELIKKLFILIRRIFFPIYQPKNNHPITSITTTNMKLSDKDSYPTMMVLLHNFTACNKSNDDYVQFLRRTLCHHQFQILS